MSELLLEATRGSLIETVQRGHLAVVDTRGRLLAWVGDPQYRSYLRSSAKPLQATVLVESGAAERYGISGALLAVCCSSHHGEPGHVEAVSRVLAQAGLDAAALQCGIHAPIHQPAAAALWRSGQEPTALHNNCSGKHAAMLASCQALGVETSSYLSPEHPVQQAILRNISTLTGVPQEQITIGVDGCSVPVHGVPIAGMARAFAALANPDTLASHAVALGSIAEAMSANPWYVSGTTGDDSLLMARAAGRLVAKGGADGVLCVGVRGSGVGLALKMESGRNERSHAVAIAALHQLGLLSDDEVAAFGDLALPPIFNHRRIRVGEARPAFALQRAADH